MDSRFKIFKKGCILSIYGLEQNCDEYMYEDEYDISPSFRQYKYSESVTINAVYSISFDDKYTLEFTEIIPHDERVDQSDYSCTKDGLFELCHIILPNQDFINNLIKWPDLAQMYSAIYYYGDDCLFYKYNPSNNTTTQVDINLILEITDENSSIIKSCQQAFNTCYLEHCLYNNVKTTVNSFWGKCITKPAINNTERDLIWMALYVIKYLVEMEQYYEAQRILGTLTDCGGLCTTSKYTKNGCGCT